MFQGELIPAEPPSSRGFRLHKLEVLNWGTFDGSVHSVRPNGETTLLVGQNGSGKSTLVDALLTLLVRPGVRNFNVAAGARKTERDDRSYLKGAYDRTGDEDGRGIEVKFLRPGADGYSVILACFHNADTRRTFTLAELLYLGADQGVEKVYCFADHEKSISADFAGLGGADRLLTTLRNRGWKTTRTFVEYEGWLLQTIRARPKAMEVFNQTVAVKDIQRLNDFIRQHMLEPHPWNERVDGLLAHFVQLREAHRSLLRVRQQFELLEPIARLGRQYASQAQALREGERLERAAGAYFAQRLVDLFVPEVERLDVSLGECAARKQALAADIEDSHAAIRRLQNEIDEAGGARLQQLPILISSERTHADAKRRVHDRFHEALRRAGLDVLVEDEDSLARLRGQIASLREQLEVAVTGSDEARVALLLERGELRRAIEEHRQELEGLQQRQENLPEWAAALRRSICSELGIAASEVPFAAELVAVAPSQRDWEASIERVLRPFALSLLVPQRLYHLVSRYVDRTRLADGRGRGQRLVYLRVGESVAPEMAGPAPGAESMLRKLVFRDGHPLLPWVRAELQRQFD